MHFSIGGEASVHFDCFLGRVFVAFFPDLIGTPPPDIDCAVERFSVTVVGQQ